MCSTWSLGSGGRTDQVSTKINIKSNIVSCDLTWEARDVCSELEERGRGAILSADEGKGRGI